ncbi:hypothetical protein RN001_005614 [Aquatica leii]|uniref:Uncharacterized protein n=1 Tax=Aquatica leii TaxID=1421715 RepID=A0AAN7P6T0_9COLE|nr:hypothetical protein RN001_005614 [Aquatica leii]
MKLLSDKRSNHCTHLVESSILIDITHNDVESEDSSVDVSTPSTLIPSASTPPTSTHKKRKTSEVLNLATLLEFKKEESARKQERRKEKLAVEEKKVALLEKKY